MPMVLVHGNPEAEAIWDELRHYLGRDDVLALSPPGPGDCPDRGPYTGGEALARRWRSVSAPRWPSCSGWATGGCARTHTAAPRRCAPSC
jgi:pimeloyl-ACP methyl ester carboxylesterase